MKHLLLLAWIALTVAACTRANRNDLVLCHGGDYVANRDFVALARFDDFKDAHPEPQPVKLQHGGVRVEFPVEGGPAGKGFLARSHFRTNKVLLIFHEWWGMNEYVLNEAIAWSHYFDAHVLAVDLYDGKVAADREEAARLMQGVNPARAEAIIRGAAAYCGPEAKLYTMGWCFGGTWSLQAALLLEDRVKGCVVYYGMPEKSPEKLQKLSADVLFVHAMQDKWITDEVVNAFEQQLLDLGKKVTVKRYDADHAFANPSGSRYQEEAAQDARQQTIQFLGGL